MHKTAPAIGARRRKTPNLRQKSGVIEYYGYRDYDAASGRWTGRDPLGEFGGPNLYNVLSNQIIDRVDYLGLVDWEFWKKVLIEVGNDLADPKTHWEAFKLTRPGLGKRDPRALREACDNNNTNTTYRPKTKGANSRDKKQIDDAAKEAKLNEEKRKKFGKFLERFKEVLGRGGSDNFSYKELLKLAEEFSKRGLR